MNIWSRLLGLGEGSGQPCIKPDGTVEWTDKNGEKHSRLVDPELLRRLEAAGALREVYRILIKDPRHESIQEDYWELTPDQVKKFVDKENTAYCMIVYREGQPQSYLMRKDVWDALPGYNLR